MARGDVADGEAILREAVLSALPHGAIVYAVDGRCRGANRVAEDLLGVSTETLLSQDLGEIQLWKQSGLPSRAREAMRTGASQSWEARFASKTGKPLWLEFRATPIDVAGEPALLLVFSDLAERKTQEAERKQLIDGMNDTALVLDFEGEFLEANDRAVATLGYSRRELLAMKISDIDTHLSSDVIADVIEQNRSGQRKVFETLYRSKGDRIFPVEVSCSLISYRGKPAILCVARDITDRKQAEGTLRESEERYRVLADSTSELIFSFDRDLRLTGINRAAATSLGLSVEAGLGKSFHELGLPAETYARWQSACAKVLSTGRAVENRISEMRFPGGIVRIIETTLHPIWDADGGVSGVRGVARDVTDRVQAEAKLERSRQRLRLHVEHTPLAVIEFDVDGRVVDWNPAAETVFGYSRAEALGQAWTFIVPEAFHYQLDGVWESLVALQGGLRSTNENVTKDGRTIQCEWYNTSLIGSNGGSIGVASLVMDVTERRQAEQALNTSQTQLAAAMDLADLVSWELDLDSGMFTFNDRFYALYATTAAREGGYQMPAAVYSNEFVHPDERFLVAQEIKKAIESEDPYYRADLEHRIVRRDGEIRNMVVRYGITKDQFGRTIKTHGANQDITERKRTEEALEQAEAQLRQAQKMEAVGQLAGGIAHDFNNLLTAVIGNSDLVLQSLDAQDPNRELVADIKEVGERAAGLTGQILAFSRRQMLRPEVLCLNQVVTRLEPLLQRTLGEHVRVRTLLAPGLDHVEVDPDQMGQVLMNLALNARDAMPDGGDLLLKTANIASEDVSRDVPCESKPGPYVVLTVSDSGCGMDERTRSRIFEPFFTTKEVGKGTGLGLSTVFGIVKQSGGSISVESGLGEGTTFRVYLPAHEQSAPFQEDSPRRAGLTTGEETILVVEDEVRVRELILRVLTRSGYRVLEAGSAAEAEQVLAITGLVPDLLLTDVVLPGGKSGRALAEDVNSSLPGLPLIFISGYTQDSAVFDGTLGGDVNFLKKPFSPGEILESVRAALDAG